MGDPGHALVDQRPRYALARLAVVACLGLTLVSRSVWADDPWVYVAMESLGVLLVMAAVLGRFWAILYIGGRKSRVVVDQGPYAMCRHPLYACSIIGAVGLGLMFGSLVLAAALGGLAWAILTATARREEAALLVALGPAYADYAARVPRLLPDPRLLVSPDEVTVRTAALRTNLADALGFLALVPAAQLVKLLRELGPGVLLHLP